MSPYYGPFINCHNLDFTINATTYYSQDNTATGVIARAAVVLLFYQQY